MRWLALPALLVIACGCSETVAVHVVAQPDVEMLTAREDGCDARIYVAEERVADACREVGDVFLGDTGFTTNCGRARMWDELRRQTCRFGADAAQIIRAHEEGSYGSSCYQVRARFLVCPNADVPDADGGGEGS